MRHDTERRGTLWVAGPTAIPTVTAAQMREVDRLMVEDLHVELLQMMESAGHALAVLARRALQGDPRGKHVVVLAGRGGNGGGGLAAARWLANWGARVSVVLAHPKHDLTAAPAHQLAVLERMGVDVRPDDAPIAGAELILDALVGYDLHGEPQGRVAELIGAANAWRIPTIALDVPSGLDPDTGEAAEPTIRAMSTLTLALPKTGLVAPVARRWVGELYLADISVPDLVYRRLGLTVGPIFAKADIVALEAGAPEL